VFCCVAHVFAISHVSATCSRKGEFRQPGGDHVPPYPPGLKLIPSPVVGLVKWYKSCVMQIINIDLDTLEKVWARNPSPVVGQPYFSKVVQKLCIVVVYNFLQRVLIILYHQGIIINLSLKK
jgi:hypothetical protein